MAALPRENCFLVVVAKGSDEIMGYMAMQVNRVHRAATIHYLVVSQPYRRHRIGSRLVGIARQWAKEHDLIHLMTECQTQNYPAICFCQQVGLKFCGYNDQYFPNQDIAVFFSQTLQ
jgi:GNAT superfamily N-acetyltransferase